MLHLTKTIIVYQQCMKVSVIGTVIYITEIKVAIIQDASSEITEIKGND